LETPKGTRRLATAEPNDTEYKSHILQDC